MELKTCLPEGSVCRACPLAEYHVDNLERRQNIFRPYKLNDNQTSDTALVIVLPAPYIEQSERLAELRRVFVRKYSKFEDEQIYVIFGVACNYPPNANLLKSYMQSCSKHFTRMLELCIHSHKKAKLLTLGGDAIKELKILGFKFADGATTSIGNNRIIMHDANPYKVPVFCSVSFDRYTLGSSQEEILASDLDFMDKMVSGTYQYKKLNYTTILSIEEANDLRQKIQDKVKADGTMVMAVDTETTSLNIFGRKQLIKLLTVQISFETGVGYTIPIDHTDQTDPELREVCNNLVRDILSAKKIIKIMHNAMYDFRVFFRLKYKVVSLVWDTLLMHHLIDSHSSNGLKFLTRKYLEYGNYDEPLDKYIEAHPEADPSKGGNYGEIPLHLLSEYGAYDAAATYELFFLFSELLKEAGLMDLYLKQTYPALLCYLRMSCTGIRIDYEMLKRFYVEYGSAMRDYYENEMATIPAVRQWELNQPENQLYAEYMRDPEAYKRKYKKRVAPKKMQFNPKSPKHMPDLLINYCNIPVLDKTPKGAPSYNKDVRELLMELDPKKNPYGVDLTIIHVIHTYLLQRTEFDTFVKGFYERDIIDEHSRIHTNVNLAGTATGRLACNDPNMQNLPSRGERLPGYKIKSLFRPPAGKVMIQLDYSQAELRVLASVANDAAMLDAFLNDIDVHQQTASRTFGIPLDEVQPEQRQSAKSVNFGLVYGRGEESLAVEIYTALGGDENKAAEMYMRLVNEGFSGTWRPRRQKK